MLNKLTVVFAFLSVLYMMGTLSYRWSFTDTNFGGWLGFGAPIALCIACFVFGRAFERLTQTSD